jgi:hypothetical protein
MSDFTVAEYNFADRAYTLRRRVFDRDEALTAFAELCKSHQVTVYMDVIEAQLSEPGRCSVQAVAGNYGLSITTMNNQPAGIGRPIQRKEPSC